MQSGARFAVMQYLWLLVKNLPDAMSAVFSNNRVIVCFSVLLNGVPQITQCCTRRDLSQCLIQALLRNTHQPLRVRCYITDAQHDAGVTMPAIFYHGDVDVDDIAAFQPL